MLQFSKEEMRNYVESKLPGATIIDAKKVGNTIAVQGTIGQEVVTLEVDANGNEYVERTGVVTLDPETNEPGWILTKTDSDNKPVLNSFGHTNQYIVPDSKFKSMYEPSQAGLVYIQKVKLKNLFKPMKMLHLKLNMVKWLLMLVAI